MLSNLSQRSPPAIMKQSRQAVQEKYSGLLTWELYNWQYYSRKGRPVWVIHDGPPFASGKAHLGNLYNKTLKDIINRYKLLRGFRVHFIPGFDCHGTSIEDLALASEQGQAPELAKLDLGIKKKQNQFESEALRKRKIIREYAKRSALTQMQDYNKWGIMTDWRYSYLTMSKT